MRKNANQFSVGIIDKDKKDIDYIRNEFTVLNDSIKEYALLHKHNERHHYIIQLCPVSETWICNVSKEIGIDLVVEHGMYDVPKELIKITKSVISKYDPKFEKLFKQIVRKSEDANFEPVLKLRSWLRILVDSNYQADLNELRK